jgi:hypothetical protein
MFSCRILWGGSESTLYRDRVSHASEGLGLVYPTKLVLYFAKPLFFPTFVEF